MVRGFYFWTDTDFTSLAAAQADGNQDGDSNVADNQGFLLVVDQAWFESVGWKNQSANLKNVGSSSDRVDAALNSFVGAPVAPVAPVAVADNANGEANLAGGAAVEAGSGSAGTPAFGNVLTNDNSGDSKVVKAVGTSSASKPVNALTSSANGTVVVGLFGTLTLGADGSYRYVVNDANPQIEALRSASDTLVDSFTYSMADTAGATATTTLNVTIRGANDAPEASDDYNTAKESIATSDQYGLSDSTGSQATGNVLTNDLDLDRGDTKTIVGSSLSGYASALTEGSSTTTVNLTASTGAISANDYVFLKNSNGTLTPLKDSSGNVVRVDRVVSSQIYLSDSAAVSALPSGSTLLFSNKADGTGAAKTATLQSVTTTITASTALAISSSSGNIAEGMTVTGSGIESGTLVSSVNYGSDGKIIGVTLSKSVALATTTSLSFSNSATAGTSLTGQYGTLQLNANGGYIYTPTANNPALSEGKSAFEQFRYTMRDASGVSREATLYIAVAGSDTKDPNAVNDDALATEAGGTANGAAGQNPSGGNLLANDTNSSNAVVSARTAGDETSTTVDTNTQLVGLYGTLTLSSDGSYTYLADNSNATVQALRDTSTTLTDTFIYTVENGQVATDVRLQDSATLTITIRGANDAPVATDAEAAATEAGGVNNGTAGYNPSGNVLNAVTDVDDIRSELRVTAVRTGGVEGSGSAGTVGSALAGQYGSLTLNADGSWTYTVNNNNATVQALNPGETLTERFNYTVTDRSGTGLSDMAVLTLTIDGAADTVAVNSVFVNEASPYAVFTVSGSAGVAVNLSLSDSVGLPASDARATLGSDLGSALEYYDGSAWVGYTPGSQVVIPSGDKLLVRVAINQDNVHEGNESFTLTATASVGSSIGIGTINDEGEGDVYLPGNRTGAPDVPGSNGSPVPDDDRPTIAISSVSVNEGETAEFVVSLDKPSSTAISFSPNLVTDTATIDVDTAPAAQLQRFNGTNWVTVSGPVSIGPGEVSVRLRIATMDDSLVESDESFTLQTGAISGTVTNPGGAAGIATVRDNDMPLTANSEPVAFNDTLTATEDTPVTYTASQLLGNDSDADGSQLTIASVTSGTGGTAVLNSDGTVTFTPNANFNGVATFSYTVTDGSLTSNVATVTINVGALNDAPVAVNDTLATTEDTPITYTASQLIGNDSDVDGDRLSIASVTSGTGGTAVLNSDGTVTFTPNANFNGVATFSYAVTDGSLSSNIATVTVNVGAVNDAPVAVNDTLTATEDTPVTYTASQLLGNDSDADGSQLTIASVTSGTGGTAVLNSDGTVTFTPNANFNGVATFSYTVTDGSLTSNVATVTINVGALNDAPVAVNDTLATTEDTPITYTASELLGNDSDADGNQLTIASVTGGTGGTAVLNSDGTVTFTPNANFNGVATFSYAVTDGSLISNIATVTVNVGALNDAPVAVNDTFTATEDTPITYTASELLGNDSDTDGNQLTIASVTSGTGGTAVLNSDGTVTFTPNANFNGVATFSYTVTDGSLTSNVATVTINVGALNDAPVAVNDTLAATEDTPITYTASELLGNDSDADGNQLTIASVTSGTGGTAVLNSDGTVTFTPNANFNGVATFSYTVTDGSLISNIATVTVNVGAVNDAPVAVNDTLATTEDTPITYTASQLLNNDSDADGNQLTIASVTSGTGGTAVLNSDGTVTFTPNANFNGVATFSYTVTDGSLSSNVATVTVNIGAANDAAVIGGNATGTVTEDFIVKGQGNLSAGGVLTVTDGDTGEASFVGTVTPSTGALGTLTISPTGEWAYNVPNSAVQYLKAGETRVEMFTVRTLDGTSQQVSVTIQGVNDPAIFVPNGQDGYVQEDTQLVSEGQLSVTDADQGEATILVQTATRGQYGEFSIDASGRWGYVLDNDSPAVQALGTADTRTETFAVSARDGTRTAVTVVVRGLDEVSQPQAPAEPPPMVTAPPQPSAPAPVPSPTVPAPEAPPASIAAPFDSAVATRPTASMTASPITVAMQRMADPAQAFSSFAFTDLYTSSSGFTVVVIESPQPRLSLYRGVSDQYADAGTDTSFAVPYDAFAHSDPNERILLSAGLADGQSLPGWVRFDPQSGKFEIQAPDGYNGELMIKVMARDTQGREATVLFRFTVGERKAIERNGRAGLSEQLRQAGQRPIAALERAVEASKLADAPRGKQAG